MMHAQPVLDIHRRCGKSIVRGRGCNDDEIEVIRCHPGIGESRTRRLLAKRSRGFTFAGDIALTDAGALDDPIVAGIDNLLHLGIGHDALGERRPKAANN